MTYTRDEDESEQLDRNWNELLQELRVTQTGVQILTGFLLTLPFQARFTELSDEQRRVFLVLCLLSALTTGLLIAPVGLHRMLFRRRAKDQVIALAHRAAQAGLVFLCLVVSGVVYLVFDVVVGIVPAIVVGLTCLIVLGVLWFGVPALLRRED
jgi:hypothetical protein